MTHHLPIHFPTLTPHHKRESNRSQNLHWIGNRQPSLHAQRPAMIPIPVLSMTVQLLLRLLSPLLVLANRMISRFCVCRGVAVVADAPAHFGQWERARARKVVRAHVVGVVEEDTEGDHLDADYHGLDAEVYVRVRQFRGLLEGVGGAEDLEDYLEW